jgi:outer membrane protein OmpA-like peptidoglycan-associated protein
MDNQANEIARSLGTGVNNDPLAALNQNRTIIVSKTDQTDSSKLQSSARSKVNKVAQLLRNYPQTAVMVAGYTDDQGSFSYNQGLSEKRANTVAYILAVNSYPMVRGYSFDNAIVPETEHSTEELKSIYIRTETE